MGLPLKAPLTCYDIIYTLPMLTIKEDKGVVMSCDIHVMIARILRCSKAFLVLCVYVYKNEMIVM